MIELKTNGIATGYLAVGFARQKNFLSLTFNDANGQPYPCSSPDVSGSGGNCGALALDPVPLSRQLAVFYDLDGNRISHTLYNFGEFWGAMQDDNGNIYMFGIGGTPRRMIDAVEFSTSTDPHLTPYIFYNPTATNFTTLPLECDLTDSEGDPIPFQRKANLIKINSNGTVLWNNYYGLADYSTVSESRSFFKTGLIHNGKLVMGGYARYGLGPEKKYIAKINAITGYIEWGTNFHSSTDGDIFEINRQGNSYVISGFEEVIPGKNQGFVARVNDAMNGGLSVTSFTNPVWYQNATTIAPSIPSVNIDLSISGRSTSAVFSNGKIYWFLIVNKLLGNYGNGIADGLVIEMDFNGNALDVDNIGGIRAFDLWLSGIPTSDGGIALITSRHSPTYYGGTAIPSLNTPMDVNNPTGSTIGDCLNDFLNGASCSIMNPNDRFWEMMSTCSYVRKYNSNFELEWDKIWDSSDNAARECFPGNFKQQECMYRIAESSIDGGLVVVGNTSTDQDDAYIVKLENDCGLSDFYGAPVGPDILASYGTLNGTVTEITSNTTWSTPKQVLGTIRVNPGVTLTIQNTVVEFTQGSSTYAGIMVEPNGHLIVDNSVLTSGGSCDQFWQGIAVHGNSSQHQYAQTNGDYYQGRATIRNNSSLEYAANGVANWSGTWGEVGGIIKVSNSTFYNCRRAVQFMEYQNFSQSSSSHLPERSNFFKTRFLVDDLIPIDLNNTAPLPQVTLWKTDRLLFTACDFINSSSAAQSEYFGSAIYSKDANYKVQGYCNVQGPFPGNTCSSFQRSTFVGWHKAILAAGSASTRTMTVTGSEFHANMVGIEINAAEYSQIYNNEFQMGDHPFVTHSNYGQDDDRIHLGIFTNTTSHFSIENNSFTLSPSASFDGRGVLVYQSEGAQNQIYMNDFSKLKTAVNGWQVNRNLETEGNASVGMSGLQYLCNTNDLNQVDFEVSRTFDPNGNTQINSGIRNSQGNIVPVYKPAANTFSPASPNPNIYTHFTINSMVNYDYVHFNNPPLASEISPNTMFIESTPVNNNTCPSNFTSGMIGSIKGSHVMQKRVQFEGIKYVYLQLLDNGNTSGMLSEIALSWPEDAWDLRDELIARSPYNSEAVLIAAIQKNIMPHAMLLEVLLANPDALRSGRVILEAENTPVPPLPQNMIDLLYAAQNQSTFRTTMELTLAAESMELQRLQKKVLFDKATADSTYLAPDSTIYYLSMVKSVEGNYARAAAMVDRGYFSNAVALLDSMRVNYRLQGERYAEMGYLQDFYNFLGSVDVNGRHIADLTDAEIASLQTIAENQQAGKAAINAQNALCFHYNICYDADGTPKKATAIEKPIASYKELVAQQNTAIAFPNPADEYLTISYHLLNTKAKSELTVFDALGRKVIGINLGEGYDGQELIDTRKLAEGIYIFTLSQDGEKVSDGKFIIAH